MAKVDTDNNTVRKFGSGLALGTALGAGLMAAKKRRERQKSAFHKIADQLSDRL